MNQVITRFAPSPTGYLHIGGARTALFSYLLARKNNGKFLLRIEDTDRERSTKDATDAIIESMAWLGLEHDGEIVFQSEKEKRHNEVIDLMVANNTAYYCTCSKEEVEAMREQAMSRGEKPKYNGCCRDKNHTSGVVRLKAPLTGNTNFVDLIKGPISFDNQELDDMVLRRADNTPTYNLAVVVDDYDMQVTQVIRGDDHVNNTPKQILIYQAMGWDIPEFGHVPMILGADKKKLSKRENALSVMEYQKMGYLPDALLNYLVRLGWSHGDQELFSKQELIDLFSTDSLGSSASVFDTQKLDWINAHYLKECSKEILLENLHNFCDANDSFPFDLKKAEQVLPLLITRAKTFVDMCHIAQPFFVKSTELIYEEKVQEVLTKEKQAILKELLETLEKVTVFDHDNLETAIKKYLEEKNLKFKVIGIPLRIALTGSTASPGGIYEVLEILDKAESLARIKKAVEYVLIEKKIIEHEEEEEEILED